MAASSARRALPWLRTAMRGELVVRRALDAALVAAAVVGLYFACFTDDDGPPPMPPGVCDASAADATSAPPWAALTAPVGRRGTPAVSVAVVLGRLDNEAEVESAQWSAQRVRAALRRRGFSPSPANGGRGERWQRAAPTPALVELFGPVPDDATAIDAALERAASSHRVVYYHGHSHRGELRGFADRPDLGQRLWVIDSCYSTQYYAGTVRSAAPRAARIVNRRRSVTGSVGSFPPVLDALLAAAATGSGPSWRQLLGELNARADERAARRQSSDYPEPERYGVAQPCPSPPAGAVAP